MNTLTNRQREILNFIEISILKNGYPPSVKEIADGVGLFSVSTVHGHLISLEKKGYIQKNPRSPRTIKILNKETNFNCTKEFPIVTNIEDYNKLKSTSNELEFISFPIKQKETKNGIIFIAKNDDLKEEGIYKNDYLFIDMYEPSHNGDIVLIADKGALNLIKYSEKDYKIIGKLTNVLRLFA